ncbi:hypothetical protein VIGAN_UM148600 [Vigna angularis var. angularis]|uniref:Uncharacterized protein n=1 Tax=Vigna angularis var. angularis TaxID=157739 RepID=A0A0S3TEV2_PHAAN|nr:hypothetical protein VIGAN_UM148600 [Vigna angularis var. angularis]
MKVWTLDAALQRCQWPRHFREILSQTILTGLISDPYAASRLINFSTRSALVPFDYSLRIFNHLHNPNPFTWNTIMRAHFELQNNPHQASHSTSSSLRNTQNPITIPTQFLFNVALPGCPTSREGSCTHMS